MRQIEKLTYSADEVGEIISYLCATCERQLIYYLWRPFLRDPKDDHVLEVAVAGSCDTIVTYNGRDFRGVDRFGLKVQPPREFLLQIGEIS